MVTLPESYPGHTGFRLQFEYHHVYGKGFSLNSALLVTWLRNIPAFMESEGSLRQLIKKSSFA